MKNWKTTLAALLTNVAYLVLTAMQTGGLSTRDIALAAGLQVVGTLAKDFNVTGSARKPGIK